MDAVRQSLLVGNTLKKFTEPILLFLVERGQQTPLMLAGNFSDLPHCRSSCFG